MIARLERKLSKKFPFVNFKIRTQHSGHYTTVFSTWLRGEYGIAVSFATPDNEEQMLEREREVSLALAPYFGT